MLEEIDSESKLTERACADILDAVHIEYKKSVGTVYSNVFDLVDLKAYVYHLHDFDRSIEFDLLEELSRIESNDGFEKYRMMGGSVFSKLEGVRIHLIQDLF